MSLFLLKYLLQTDYDIELSALFYFIFYYQYSHCLTCVCDRDKRHGPN